MLCKKNITDASNTDHDFQFNFRGQTNTNSYIGGWTNVQADPAGGLIDLKCAVVLLQKVGLWGEYEAARLQVRRRHGRGIGTLVQRLVGNAGFFYRRRAATILGRPFHPIARFHDTHEAFAERVTVFIVEGEDVTAGRGVAAIWTTDVELPCRKCYIK